MDNRLTLDINVADLLGRWPEAIPIFLRHKLSCVGCSLAPFDTLEDVAAIYHFNPDAFMDELIQVIQPANRPL
jgi:hybrid cluster-associated redox disulfide protein